MRGYFAVIRIYRLIPLIFYNIFYFCFKSKIVQLVLFVKKLNIRATNIKIRLSQF